MNADAISRIKAVRGHHSCQTPQRLNHRRSVAQEKKCTIRAPRLWQLPHFLQGDSGARAVALQAEECDKRLYLLPPPPPRHVPGWTQLRTLALISVTRRSSPDGTEQTAACHAGADTHTALAYTHTNIHTYRHTSTHELTVSLDGACQVRSRTPPPFPPPLPPPPSRAVCSSTHAPLDSSIHNDLCKPTLRQ